MRHQQRIIQIVTDGACLNSGQLQARGGWSAILRSPEGRTKEIAGPLEGDQQTNNRAELTAVIKGLQALKNTLTEVEIVTDSAYVKNGCTTWLANWKMNGWRTADRNPVANADLWQILDQLLAEQTVHFKWVKGHSGHPENERADALAQRAALGERIERYGP
ncbi:ribonuclease HI [Pseudomonas otitidis]|uniref:Ribonuclease H n=1 Tax=Metapseudomonas otitidis TaxID=319939 RepID=A0A7X3HDK2_9GAMM|nr:ribonuclease HI [Pseudomonas otitidis]MWK59817.1 ribonuclease HI [Pseudomonas otitidis]